MEITQKILDENNLKWYAKRAAILATAENPETSLGKFNEYSKWPDIYKAFWPVMQEHKMEILIGLGWHNESATWLLKMRIEDKETGFGIDDVYPMINESNSNQGLGGSQTYAKRYMFSNIMGIKCGEEDDDGQRGRDAADKKNGIPVSSGSYIDASTVDRIFDMWNRAGKDGEVFNIVKAHCGNVKDIKKIPYSFTKTVHEILDAMESNNE